MRQWRRAWVPGCLMVLAFLSPPAVQAQGVSCTGVAAWNPSTIYNAGDRLVYQNQLYQANLPIWNTPPTHCPSCNYYTLLGPCGGGGNTPPTVAITAPANNASFSAGANITIS